jgi:tetratricopeptide (TPR) repeat protein
VTGAALGFVVAVALGAEFVGRQACVECHPGETDRWSGSHHDLAMQPADPDTVLGDFDDATLTHFGVTSTFFERDGGYYVSTDGPDGASGEFRITHVFGVTPLQQYLVEFPGGRSQVLPLCWDTRPAAGGGQRWFHLYPGEPIGHDDVLHWTGPNQNWNFACAECHSTNLRRGYDRDRDRYATTWSEIDVSCEACHGPGSEHVRWARAAPSGDPAMGLAVRFEPPAADTWFFDGESPIATRRGPPATGHEVEMCARCHSRRVQIHEDYVYGRPLLDTHRPALLTEGLYHADGQIQEEVYVYGSFLQSRMHREGVVCSDCHDSHSLALHAPGNGVCHRCHSASVFDVPSHHFHEPGTPGAACVDCHMPVRTYMVVDPRRDHSFRVPRPDLSVKLGTPNACTDCHADRSAPWAANAVAGWYEPQRRTEPRYGEALHAGRSRAADAVPRLTGLVADGDQPGIARATALSLLTGFPTAATLEAIAGALDDDDPLVRTAAVEALAIAGPEARVRLAAPRLEDPVRSVRIGAARVLAPAGQGVTEPAWRAALVRAVAEYIASELTNADRPEAHLNLGNFYAESGRLAEAEASYRQALAIDRDHVPALVNLADLYRLQRRDDEGERLLRRALAIEPEQAAVHHAFGLLLVRQRRGADALESLGRAAQLDPANPRFIYVYAVALHSSGRTREALSVVESGLVRHPRDPALREFREQLE